MPTEYRQVNGYFPDHTLYFNQKPVIDIFKKRTAERYDIPVRNVVWENMPFKKGDIVNHREYGPCFVWKIMSKGVNEGQLDLATCSHMHRFSHGGVYAREKLRADIDEVDEMKFENDDEYKKWFNSNIELYK